jgi:hypothetical protein
MRNDLIIFVGAAELAEAVERPDNGQAVQPTGAAKDQLAYRRLIAFDNFLEQFRGPGEEQPLEYIPEPVR